MKILVEKKGQLDTNLGNWSKKKWRLNKELWNLVERVRNLVIKKIYNRQFDQKVIKFDQKIRKFSQKVKKSSRNIGKLGHKNYKILPNKIG